MVGHIDLQRELQKFQLEGHFEAFVLDQIFLGLSPGVRMIRKRETKKKIDLDIPKCAVHKEMQYYPKCNVEHDSVPVFHWF